MDQPYCFDGCGRRASGYSAYCAQCQGKHVRQGPEPRGQECLCAQCLQLFTSVSAFDRHQTIMGGETVCADPRTADRRDGSPVFKVCRERDGYPVWGVYDARGRRWGSNLAA